MSRTKKLATLIGAVFVIVLFVAPIAAAHHPAITVTMDCNGKVSYTVTAWDTNDASARTFTGVKVYCGLDAGRDRELQQRRQLLVHRQLHGRLERQLGHAHRADGRNVG